MLAISSAAAGVHLLDLRVEPPGANTDMWKWWTAQLSKAEKHTYNMLMINVHQHFRPPEFNN